MSEWRTGAGAATRPAGYGSHHVDPTRASALVLPSLVALGPPLDLERLRSPYYQDRAPSRLDAVARAGQILLATAIGLVMLALPMVALGWAASEAYAVVAVDPDAPTVEDSYVPKGSVLDPAYVPPSR